MRFFTRIILFTSLLIFASGAIAQPKLEINLRSKDSTALQDRQLPSERLAEKRFTFMRHFWQNNFTHYNYYFNANEIMKEIVGDARLQHKDDYTQLLSFYPYSLESTSRSIFLDTIIQKCTAGILLHDLRNDWIDNLYMVLGKAYLLRQNFDSASMTFQYINYNFAPKEDDGYSKVIGSNASEGNNALTVSTKEKSGAFSYLVTSPPSRNDALVWQVRALTEDSNYIDASSLIETLENDPNFPDRLELDLVENKAYLYYRLKTWDSAAAFLEKSIPNATNQEQKARQWFLTGQLYQLANDYENASNAYGKCTSLALDPVMEVYARLNSIRLNKSDDPRIIDENIDKLLSMAKKDKYQSYRDIIYYAVALFELERNGYDPASKYLTRSIYYNENNLNQRSASYMLLGDIAFTQKKYADAGVYYDSVDAEILPEKEALLVGQRQPPTHEIYEAVQIVNLQDSLLQLAKLDEAERTDLVKQIGKRLRKERGLKEEPSSSTGNVSSSANALRGGNSAAPTSLFNNAGAWYFYDVSIRANGFNKFKEKWGARPNVDNWRRSSAVTALFANQGSPDQEPDAGAATAADVDEHFDSTDISFDNLYSRIPISPERQDRAKNRIIQAYYREGVALHEQLEDYPEAIKVFEKILSLQDTGGVAAKSIYALIHCYTQLGDMAKAASYRKMLTEKFDPATLAGLEQQGNMSNGLVAKTPEATDAYKKIYDLFIEGNFSEAIAEKQKADSIFGKNYWTPQLLYIEAVYHVKEREDSLAVQTLQHLITEFPDQPLASRAKTMIDVVGRRKEIEDYLTNLEITRAREDEVVTSVVRPARQLTPVIDTIARPMPTKVAVIEKKDTLVTAVPTKLSPYTINPNEPAMVAVVLERIDPSYVNEVWYALNASSRKNYNGQPVEAVKQKLKDNLWLVLLRSDSFQNAETAFSYINYIKPIIQKELVTWLEPAKYNFTILSQQNLGLLLQDPNLALYQEVLGETFPGKF